MKQATILFFLFFSIVNLFGQNVNTLNEQGNALIERNEIDSAIGVFSEIIKLDKYHSNSYYNLGVCYMMKGEFNSSIPFFNKTILLDSNYHEARFNRAAAYSKTNNFLFAIFDYEYYIQKVPEDSLAYYNKAMVHSEMGEKENALIELNNALKLSPNYAKAIYERAILYRSQLEYAKALSDIKSCLRFDKMDSMLLIQQADLNFLLNNYIIADSLYTNLSKGSKNIYFLEQIAFSRMYAGKNWPCLEAFALLIKQNPNNSSYYYNRAVIYINIDKNKEAELDLTRAIELKPKNLGEQLNLRGIARYNQELFNEACFDWEQASNLRNKEGKVNLDKYCEKRNE